MRLCRDTKCSFQSKLNSDIRNKIKKPNTLLIPDKTTNFYETTSVLKWFNSLEKKETLSFICFDVCEFYPSINEKLLSKALDFDNKYRRITKHELDIILHAKRSLLFSDSCPW